MQETQKERGNGSKRQADGDVERIGGDRVTEQRHVKRAREREEREKERVGEMDRKEGGKCAKEESYDLGEQETERERLVTDMRKKGSL